MKKAGGAPQSRGSASDRLTRIKEAAVALYEHVFLARQDLSQAQVDVLAATATEIVQTNGGTVLCSHPG